MNDLLPLDTATWAAPHFVSPWWLLALAALPLLAWHHHRRGGRGALTYSRLPAPVRDGSGITTALRLHLPFYCRLAALALLVLAVARPQLGYAWEETVTEGIDIQVVLDVSASMVVEDLPPASRLTVAKEVVSRFIDGRRGDRIGLTVFSGSAVTRSPLTTDRRMLNELLASLEASRRLDGTAIGVGLASAAARLKDSEAETRVIILVTDGVNNTGSIDPASAAAICDGLGIRVYTVGIGSEGEGMGLVRVLNQATGRYEVKRQRITARFDEELLRRIAERTGGAFFHATDAGSLERIFATIDELETTEMEVKRYVSYEETFQPLAWSALVLLLLPLGAAALRLTAEP